MLLEWSYKKINVTIIIVIITYHEVSKDEGREENDHTDLPVGAHAIPERLDPLTTEDTED